MVKHDFKGDEEIDAILREHAPYNKSAFIKAAIKAYAQGRRIQQETSTIPKVKIQI